MILLHIQKHGKVYCAHYKFESFYVTVNVYRNCGKIASYTAPVVVDQSEKKN